MHTWKLHDWFFNKIRTVVAAVAIVVLGLTPALQLVPVASAATLFTDTFSVPDGLITDENVYWNGTPNSSNWEMTSGALYAQNGAAWTGTNDDVFRANTKQPFSNPIRVSMSLKQNIDIHNSNCNSGDTCWYGTHIWLGYQNEYNLYYVSVNRADGQVVIKRKVPCGTDNSGTYFVLGSAKYDWAVGKTDHYSATIETNSDGSVTLKMYDDDKSTTTPIVTGTDKGGTNPNWSSSCATPGHYSSAQYSPITAPGAVGVRGDYADFNFDNFIVSSGTGAVGTVSATATSAPVQTTTPTPTVTQTATQTNTASTVTIAAAPVPATSVVSNGLVGSWGLDGNGTGSNGGSNASAVGGVTYSSGKVGQAATFNGKNYLEIPDSNSLSPSTNGEKMTVAFWMNPATFNFTGENQGYVNLLGKGESGNQEWTFRLYNATAFDGVSRSKRMSFYGFNLAGGLGAGSYFQDNLNTNEWIFVTGVIDGSNTNIYKNGVLRDTDPLSGYNINMGNGSAPVRIGTRDMASYFQGSIDNVRIYNRALSASEINQLYQSDLAGIPTASNAAPVQTASTSGSKLTIATVPPPVVVTTPTPAPVPVVATTPTPTPAVTPTPVTSIAPVTQNSSSGPITPPVVTATSDIVPTPGIVASWVKTEEWGTDYCAKVTVKNTGSQAVTSWQTNMPVTGIVTDLWNVDSTQTGLIVGLRSRGSNGTLAPGQSYTGVGFCALYK